MKVIRMLGRGIRDSFKGVFRNFSLSFGTIICISVTLSVIAISLIGSLNVRHFASKIEQDVTMIIFLKQESNKEDVEETKKELESLPNIKELKYKSKFTVKNEMMKESNFYKTLFDNWEDSELPLKDSFEVKVKDLKKIEETAKKVETFSHVELVNYGKAMVKKMLGVFSLVDKIIVAIVGVLIFVMAVLIVNTISLAITSRSKEIEIMRVVGASNFAIRYPFVVEGMILGLLGSIIPIIIIIYGYSYFYNRLEGVLFTPIIELITPKPFVFKISLFILLIGVFVGMLGSARAVRKHFKI